MKILISAIWAIAFVLLDGGWIGLLVGGIANQNYMTA